ncbi:MAG: ABC transporter ATP-binding protein [Chloroflexota bacterium]
MKTALEVRNLKKIYYQGVAETRAVDDVSFSVTPGEFIAIVGPSGSGKTTLLAILATLLRATEGKVLISGQNPSNMSENERSALRREQIGFTFQSNNLIPYLTALENVELMLRLNNTYNNEGREHAITLLSRLGLGDRLHNLPNQLSGGQQQRVAIARALSHNPSLVLADEPTASLDTERAHQVVNTFANLIHEQQRAGIMVTHDLRMVQYADRVIKMEDGKIIEIMVAQKEIEAFSSEPYKKHTLEKVPPGLMFTQTSSAPQLQG